MDDRGKDRRTGEGLGWMTELEYEKEAWLKIKEKMREKKRE